MFSRFVKFIKSKLHNLCDFILNTIFPPATEKEEVEQPLVPNNIQHPASGANKYPDPEYRSAATPSKATYTSIHYDTPLPFHEDFVDTEGKEDHKSGNTSMEQELDRIKNMEKPEWQRNFEELKRDVFGKNAAAFERG